ncbi:MAG: isoprenyl transferase [Deltaproteobacteria bacterium]|nr:isoprenyl transferase [Deltaproteobacteria bacterium]
MTSVKTKRRRSLNSNTSSSIHADLDPLNLPLHVAIIMDGNGRWAKKRLLSRIKGHEKGSEAVRTIVRACREIGIHILTLYAFSTENWQRPQTEISALMALLKKFLKSEQKELLDNNIRLNTLGQTERLPEDVRHELEKSKMLTKENTGLILNLALSYGGRDEIVKAVKEIAKKAIEGRIDPDSITPDFVSKHLYTGKMPDPDLLIRTSGEMRISNFMLWQLAYTEICITDTLWPDFGKDEFIRILKNYQQRERRFGKVEP